MKISSSCKAFRRAPSTLDGKSMIVYINLGLGSWHWRPGSWEAGWALGGQVAGTGGWPWRWAPAGRPQGISWRPHWEFAWKLRKALPNSQSGTPGNFLESPLGISVGTPGNCLESHPWDRASIPRLSLFGELRNKSHWEPEDCLARALQYRATRASVSAGYPGRSLCQK